MAVERPSTVAHNEKRATMCLCRIGLGNCDVYLTVTSGGAAAFACQVRNTTDDGDTKHGVVGGGAVPALPRSGDDTQGVKEEMKKEVTSEPTKHKIGRAHV